jgi:hypothetical protein
MTEQPRIPMRLQRCDGRKRIVASTSKPRPDGTLVKALAADAR